MSANPLQERLRAGHPCLNGWLTVANPFAAELMSQAGWDSLTVDLQHGLQDYRSMLAILQTVQRYPVTPLVRVPHNEPGIIGKVLDAGAWGVICPMINTAEDARTFVRACRYPPLGERSYGPIRARAYGGEAPYHEIANEQVLALAQVETRQAVDNVSAILDVPGVSGIYVGPADLGLSLGLAPRFDREEPQMLSIYASLLRETQQRGCVAAIHNATPAYAARMIELGFRLVTVGSDATFLGTAAHAAVRTTQKLAQIDRGM